MRALPLSHPRRVLLLTGDVVMFLAFSLLGRRAHSMGNAWEDVAFTALPFLAGWLLAAPFTEAYERGAIGTVRAAVRRAATTWMVAFPLGLLLRTALKRGDLPHWSFVLVAGVFLLVTLVGWRALLARAGQRRLEREDGNGKNAKDLDVTPLT